MESRVKDRVSLLLMVVVAGCAIVMTGMTVRREVAGPAEPWKEEQAPVPVVNWTKLSSKGRVIGPADAPVKIVVFSDFECPFCKKFAEQTMPAIRRQFPAEVSFVFRHWPLTRHKFAYQAARGAECAAGQNRFEPFHDALFAKQDDIGVRPWVDYAQDAGVPDVQAFSACIESDALVPSIEEDLIDAKSTGGTGTPTVVVDGVRMKNAPDSANVAAVVTAALQRQGLK